MGFVFNHGKASRKMRKAQNYIDQQCVDKMRPFVPVADPKYKNSGRMRDSIRIEQPGKIVHKAVRVRHQYYDLLNHKNSGNPQATRFWFEYMKTKHLKEILKGAKEAMK